MIHLDEDALICDLAETYQIYNYRSLPVQLVATLAAGLRENSRIKLLSSGMKVSQELILLACIADRVEAFRYGFANTKKVSPPQSLVEILTGENRTDKESVASFKDAEAFEKALARIRGE